MRLNAPASRGLRYFLLVALWLGLEYFALGPASYVALHDNGDGTLPLYIGAARSLFTDGGYWLPIMAGGVDRLGNDLAQLRLSSVLFAFLPGWVAYQLTVLLHLFLTGYFTFRIARDDLKLTEESAFFSGACAAFYSELTFGYSLSYSALPLVLWGLPRLAASKRPLLWSVLAGLAYSSVSHIATTLPFCLPLAALWYALVRRIGDIKLWLLFLAFSAAALIPQAQTFWAMWYYAASSHRAGWTPRAPSWLESAGDALGFLPRSKLPAALAVLGLAAAWFKDKRARSLGGLVLFLSVGVAALEHIRHLVAGDSALLRGYQFARFREFIPPALALAAGFGLDALRRPRLRYAALAVLLVLSLLEKARHASAWAFEGSYAANYASPILRDLRAAESREPYRVASFAVGLEPAFAQAYGFETADGYLNLYPKTYQRFWSALIEPVAARVPQIGATFRDWGNRLYLFADPNLDVDASWPLDSFARPALLSLVNVKYLISRQPLSGPQLRLHYGAPPRDRSSWARRMSFRIGENLRGRRQLFVYENTAAFPRAFLTRRARAFDGEAALWSALGSARAADLRDEMYVERSRLNPAAKRGRSFRRATAALARYEPDAVEVDVASDGDGFLIVSNNYSVDWKCRINGVETLIVPAYGAFWGVPVKAGISKAVFRYEPPFTRARP